MTAAPWWTSAVIYQVYPRSFADSNADGVGDLPGITRRLGYIADLGVDALWVSPFFRSPFKDFGYDVSDYRAVDPLFGSLSDFDTLLKEAQRLGLKVMIDQVLAHCSDQHPWFQESASSRDNPRADWFVWREAKPDGTEPNNWLSFFGGRAWSWSPKRRQYYHHNFLSSQPNLNYANEAVVSAIVEECRFWLERGVDGFRLDAIHTCSTAPHAGDNAARAEKSKSDESGNGSEGDGATQNKGQPFAYQLQESAQLDQSGTQTLLRRLRQLSDQYNDIFLMGELAGEDGMALIDKYTAGDEKLHSCYSFDLLDWEGQNAPQIREVLARSTKALRPGRVTFAVSNHDVPRAASRNGNANAVPEAARDSFAVTLTLLNLSLNGSACLYQGEELGLPEAEVPFEALQDPWGRAFWPEFKGRDGARTPMPWQSDEAMAGFSSAAKSWLPIDPRHRVKAVDQQLTRPDSPLMQVRAFLAWRRDQKALHGGELKLLEGNEKLVAFERHSAGETCLCLFNFGEAQEVELPPGGWRRLFGEGENRGQGRFLLPACSQAFLAPER